LKRKSPLTDVDLYELIKVAHYEAGFADEQNLDALENTRRCIRFYAYKRKVNDRIDTAIRTSAGALILFLFVQNFLLWI